MWQIVYSNVYVIFLDIILLLSDVRNRGFIGEENIK